MLHAWGAAITTTLFALHGLPVYLIVTLLAFGEAAAFVGLLLPGETALFVGGVLASQGNVNVIVLTLVAIAAAMAGDSVGYEIGRRLGPSLREGRLGRWIGPRRWDRAEAALNHRGATAVMVGRWVGVLRALVPAAAGAAGMPYRKFLVANIIGGALWGGLVIGLGFFAGTAWQQVQGWLGLASVLGGAAVAGWVVLEWWKRRREHALTKSPESHVSRERVAATHEPLPVPATVALDAPSSPADPALGPDRGRSLHPVA